MVRRPSDKGREITSQEQGSKRSEERERESKHRATASCSTNVERNDASSGRPLIGARHELSRIGTDSDTDMRTAETEHGTTEHDRRSTRHDMLP